MIVEVVMPKLGLTMEKGIIIKWRKKEGDLVKKGEIIVEIESEKLTGEVESPSDGVLIKIIHKEGEEVPIGEPIALIETEGWR